MTESPDPAEVERIARQSPLAAMTTVSRIGNPRVRLVHPIWDPDGRAGVILTDGTSLKALDVQARFELTTFTNSEQEVTRWSKPKSSSVSETSPD